MKDLLWILTIIMIIGLHSCKENEEIIPEFENGGVILSFDDNFVNQWYAADSRLKDYKWKATFNISYFDKITPDEMVKLHQLKNAGHEIASHGLNHLNAVDYISAGETEEYLNIEIFPMLEMMEDEGFTARTFAYPFGRRNSETDSVLLNYFDIIRGVEWGGDKPISSHDCFFNNSPLVSALGIDEYYPYFEGHDYTQYIIDLLTYAKDNNKIVILFSHRVVEDVTEEYQTSISTLELICNFVNENHMKYYTYSDLIDMIE